MNPYYSTGYVQPGYIPQPGTYVTPTMIPVIQPVIQTQPVYVPPPMVPPPMMPSPPMFGPPMHRPPFGGPGPHFPPPHHHW